MISNKVTIAPAIRQAEEFFCTGDATFSIVEILQLVLPDGSAVDHPTIGKDEAEYLKETGKWKEEIHGQFTVKEEVNGQWAIPSFRITLPGLVGMAPMRESETDMDWRIQWVIDTLSKVLNLHGRYSSNEYGPEVQDYLMVPSLSFEATRISPLSFTFEFFLDDSTR